MKFQLCFFIGVQLQCPCANLLVCSLRFKKDVLILKILLSFGFCAFGFEAIPHPSCYLNMGQLLRLFSVVAPVTAALIAPFYYRNCPSK